MPILEYIISFDMREAAEAAALSRPQQDNLAPTIAESDPAGTAEIAESDVDYIAKRFSDYLENIVERDYDDIIIRMLDDRDLKHAEFQEAIEKCRANVADTPLADLFGRTRFVSYKREPSNTTDADDNNTTLLVMNDSKTELKTCRDQDTVKTTKVETTTLQEVSAEMQANCLANFDAKTLELSASCDAIAAATEELAKLDAPTAANITAQMAKDFAISAALLEIDAASIEKLAKLDAPTAANVIAAFAEITAKKAALLTKLDANITKQVEEPARVDQATGQPQTPAPATTTITATTTTTTATKTAAAGPAHNDSKDEECVGEPEYDLTKDEMPSAADAAAANIAAIEASFTAIAKSTADIAKLKTHLFVICPSAEAAVIATGIAMCAADAATRIIAQATVAAKIEELWTSFDIIADSTANLAKVDAPKAAYITAILAANAANLAANIAESAAEEAAYIVKQAQAQDRPLDRINLDNGSEETDRGDQISQPAPATTTTTTTTTTTAAAPATSHSEDEDCISESGYELSGESLSNDFLREDEPQVAATNNIAALEASLHAIVASTKEIAKFNAFLAAYWAENCARTADRDATYISETAKNICFTTLNASIAALWASFDAIATGIAEIAELDPNIAAHVAKDFANATATNAAKITKDAAGYAAIARSHNEDEDSVGKAGPEQRGEILSNDSLTKDEKLSTTDAAAASIADLKASLTAIVASIKEIAELDAPDAASTAVNIANVVEVSTAKIWKLATQYYAIRRAAHHATEAADHAAASTAEAELDAPIEPSLSSATKEPSKAPSRHVHFNLDNSSEETEHGAKTSQQPPAPATTTTATTTTRTPRTHPGKQTQPSVFFENNNPAARQKMKNRSKKTAQQPTAVQRSNSNSNNAAADVQATPDYLQRLIRDITTDAIGSYDTDVSNSYLWRNTSRATQKLTLNLAVNANDVDLNIIATVQTVRDEVASEWNCFTSQFQTQLDGAIAQLTIIESVYNALGADNQSEADAFTESFIQRYENKEFTADVSQTAAAAILHAHITPAVVQTSATP